MFSKDLNNSDLLKYTFHINSITFSNKQFTIHHPIVNSCKTRKGVEQNVQWETFTTYSIENLNSTIISNDVQINLVDDGKKFYEK